MNDAKESLPTHSNKKVEPRMIILSTFKDLEKMNTGVGNTISTPPKGRLKSGSKSTE